VTPGCDHVLLAIGALAAALLPLWILVTLQRHRGSRAGTIRRLAIEEVPPLDARRRLMLLRCDSRALLVLTGGGEDAVIGWLPERQAP